jgi:hypothetical protein
VNNGRERGTSRPGVSNGQYNPAILQNDQPGEMRFFLLEYQPDTKNTLSLKNDILKTKYISAKVNITNEAKSIFSWITRASNFGASNILSVAYGNGVWVAGGAGGALRTSTDDAVTWNTQTSNFTTTINSVAYANGVWVAGGAGGTLRTSTDNAVTWNTQTSNFGASIIFSVAYGNGVWVAGGQSGTLRTSTNDGVTWNTQTSNFGASSIFSVAYGNGVWVAGGTGAVLRTSTNDGVTWNTQTSNFANNICSVAYGNGVWVAGGQNGRIRTSTDDGVTWNTRTSNFTTTVISVAYGNGVWVAVGSGLISAGTSLYNISTNNAVSWVDQSGQGGSNLIIGFTTAYSMAYGNGVWVAGLHAGSIASQSDRLILNRVRLFNSGLVGYINL